MTTLLRNYNRSAATDPPGSEIVQNVVIQFQSPFLRPNISLILPAHNEAGCIRESLREVDAFLRAQGLSYEIIVGDSGSSDATALLARSVALPCVRVVRVDRPGKGLVLTECIATARGEVIGFIDADLEISVSYLGPALQALVKGADAAVASKTSATESVRSRGLVRRAMTLISNAVTRRLTGSTVSDHQAGLKMFRREIILEILSEVRSTGWLWDTEVLVLLSQRQRKICQIPVQTTPRRPSRLRSPVQSIRAISDLVTVLLRLRKQSYRLHVLHQAQVGAPPLAKQSD